MNRLFVVAVAAVALVTSAAFAAERSEIPAQYKWDPSPLYANEAAWQSARTALAKRIPEAGKFQGHLGDSSGVLAKALNTISEIDNGLSRLYVYASMNADQDVRVGKFREMRESADQMRVEFSATISYLRPEILSIGADKIRKFVASDPRLITYKQPLEDILRRAPHTLTSAEEKIAAKAGLLTGAGENIRDVLTNAELPYPTVTLSDGQKVRLDQAGYTQYRALPNRADRIKVFKEFWKAHQNYQGTLGAALDAGVRTHVFNKDVHKYKSSLEAALFTDNIPTKVYTQLLADVNANLPTLHRYLKLRKRMMGVDTLRYEDLYAPIVKEMDLKYTPEEAMRLTLEAVKPLGPDYVNTLKQGMTGGWIDWMPSTGKRGGAYSTGAYGVHPFQLQNYTGLYEEVGTLAHESGHSMHTFLSDKNQPYPTHDYPIFVAEVASTLNENLLFHYMLDNTKDRDTKLFILGSYLDNLRGTLFRQVMFAEFELRIHEMAEKGETLTGENLTKLYLGIVRKYYGHDQNICKVDDLYSFEWSYIDHFFYNFYVYQYATSYIASTTIANDIVKEAKAGKSTAMRDRYLKMLSSGSSEYPIDLLKETGVDMTTSTPFKTAMKEMNSVIDEIEKLLRTKTMGGATSQKD